MPVKKKKLSEKRVKKIPIVIDLILFQIHYGLSYKSYYSYLTKYYNLSNDTDVFIIT